MSTTLSPSLRASLAARMLQGPHWDVSASFPDGPPSRIYRYTAELAAAVAAGDSVSFTGPPGVGKSATAVAAAQDAGLQPIWLFLPAMTPDRLVLLSPTLGPDGRISVVRLGDRDLFEPGPPKMVIIEERNRAACAATGPLLELVLDGSVFGRRIPDLATVVLNDNALGPRTELVESTRRSNVTVGVDDTPWREALAATYRTRDLTALFEWYGAQSPDLHAALSPRGLDRAVWAADRHLPLAWTLPLSDNGPRQRLSVDGDDRTDAILTDLHRLLAADTDAAAHDPMAAAVAAAISDPARVPVLIQGPPSSGKSRRLAQLAADHGCELLPVNVSHLEGGLAYAVPAPDMRYLDRVPFEALTSGPEKPTVLAFEDVSWAGKEAQESLLEILQEGTVAGQPLSSHITAVVLLDNPAESGGVRNGLTRRDPALNDRPRLSVTVDAAANGVDRWLITHYRSAGDTEGRVAETVVGWAAEVLAEHPEHEVTLGGRTLQRLIDRWLFFRHGAGAAARLGAGEVLLPAFPSDRGHTLAAGLPVNRLVDALQGATRLSWPAILGSLEEVVERLLDGDDHLSREVFLQLKETPLATLETSPDVVARLCQSLRWQQYRVSLYEGGEPDRNAFMVQAMTAGAEAGYADLRRQRAA